MSTEPEYRKPRALSRRGLLRLAGLAGAGMLLVSCEAIRTVPGGRASDSVQLVYQDWRTEWFPPMVQRMLEQFHDTHPNIRVFYTPDAENLEEKMLSDMQGGTAADVFQGCCTHFPIWAQKGYCLDLRPYVADDLDKETIEDWDPVQYRYFFARDGQQYGLPKYHGALALYYNRDHFDAGGLTYPDASWTYDDYSEAMGRLTHDKEGSDTRDRWGSMLDVSWDRLQVHVNAWGGHFVDPGDPRHCLIDQPEAIAALGWVRDRMWEDRVMATPLDVRNLGTRQAFVNGRVAMVEDGSWALKDILAGTKAPIGVAPMPAGPVRRATLATTDGFGIYGRTKYREAAWELLKFLISKDYGRAMAKANFLQPARASLVGEWVGFVQAEFPALAAEMNLNAFADGHIKGYSVTTEIFDNMADARRLVDAAWDRIFVLGEAPITDLEPLCREIEAAQQGGQ